MKKSNLYYSILSLGFACASCSLEETETCGNRLPAQDFASLPPIENFEAVEYNPELGRVVLRWNSEGYHSLCTASNTQAEIEVQAEVKSCTAHIRLAAVEQIDFKLTLKGRDSWKATSPKIPIRKAYDNNPGEFGLSLDFSFDYRGADRLQDQYDSLQSRFTAMRILPLARYQ